MVMICGSRNMSTLVLLKFLITIFISGCSVQLSRFSEQVSPAVIWSWQSLFTQPFCQGDRRAAKGWWRFTSLQLPKVSTVGFTTLHHLLIVSRSIENSPRPRGRSAVITWNSPNLFTTASWLKKGEVGSQAREAERLRLCTSVWALSYSLLLALITRARIMPRRVYLFISPYFETFRWAFELPSKRKTQFSHKDEVSQAPLQVS